MRQAAPDSPSGGEAQALVAQLCRMLQIPLAAAASDLAPAVAAARVEASHAATLQAVVLQLSGAAAAHGVAHSPAHGVAHSPAGAAPVYLLSPAALHGALPAYAAAAAVTPLPPRSTDLMRAAYDQVRASSELLSRVGPFY